jgi:hypothetical protein
VSVGSQSVAVITRFDRAGKIRIPFISAASLLGLPQGELGAYTMLADGIRQFGNDVAGDLRELWRRLVFSLLASNYDDHLRNHGFLMHEPGRWSLSPAYDLNPVPEMDRARVSKTAITEIRKNRPSPVRWPPPPVLVSRLPSRRKFSGKFSRSFLAGARPDDNCASKRPRSMPMPAPLSIRSWMKPDRCTALLLWPSASCANRSGYQAQPEEQVVQFLQVWRFPNHDIHCRNDNSACAGYPGLAGQHNYRRVRGFSLDRYGHLAASDIRHAQISYDHIERLGFQNGGAKQVYPAPSVGGNFHSMSVVRETIFQAFEDPLVVINAKDVQGTLRWGWRFVLTRRFDGLRTRPGNLRRGSRRITQPFRMDEFGRWIHITVV